MQDVTTFLDSPKLLLQLPKIRQELEITTIPFTDLDTLADLPSPVTYIRDKSKPISKKSFLQFLTNNEQRNIILNHWHPPNHPIRKRLHRIVSRTLKSLSRPYYLAEVFMQSVILGMASWNYDPISYIDKNSKLIVPSMAILINPRSTYPEVKTALKHIKDKVFYNYSLPPYVPHIFDYSWWYWQKLKGKTYTEIAKTVSDNKHKHLDRMKSGDCDYQSTKKDLYGIDATDVDIIKGVKKYASLLDF